MGWRNFASATISAGSSSAWATSRQPRLASSFLHWSRCMNTLSSVSNQSGALQTISDCYQEDREEGRAVWRFGLRRAGLRLEELSAGILRSRSDREGYIEERKRTESRRADGLF